MRENDAKNMIVCTYSRTDPHYKVLNMASSITSVFRFGAVTHQRTAATHEVLANRRPKGGTEQSCGNLSVASVARPGA